MLGDLDGVSESWSPVAGGGAARNRLACHLNGGFCSVDAPIREASSVWWTKIGFGDRGAVVGREALACEQ